MNKIVPDGFKVAQFRHEKSLSQEALAREARMCERMLRDVERRNRPLRQPMLRNLATALGRSMDELIVKPKQGSFDWDAIAKPLARDQLLLASIEDANELRLWATSAVSMTWQLDVKQVSTDAAALMEEILRITHRWTNNGFEPSEIGEEFGRWKRDKYDDEHAFPDLFRLARLNEILSLLREKGICVLGNIYHYRVQDPNREKRTIGQTRARIGFFPITTTQVVVRINPGVDMYWEEL